MSKINNIFASPIYLNEIKVKNKWIQYAEKIPYERNFINNGFMSKDTYILDKIPELKKQIEKSIEDYSRNILKISKKQKFVILNSWVNKHIKGDWGQDHNHLNSMFSGVYYLQDDEDMGNLIFRRTPYFQSLFPNNFCVEYDEKNILNTDDVHIETKKNLLVMFPSHIMHSIEMNKSNKIRYSLAFNVFIKGRLGGGPEMVLSI